LEPLEGIKEIPEGAAEKEIPKGVNMPLGAADEISEGVWKIPQGLNVWEIPEGGVEGKIPTAQLRLRSSARRGAAYPLRTGRLF